MSVGVTIRIATREDVPRLVAYGRQFWSETRYFAQGVEYDLDTVIAMTYHLLDEGVVLFAEDEAGEVVALMLVIIAPFLMNANYTTACEWVFYVEPEYRRSGLGAALMEEAEKILRTHGVKFFTMVSLSNVEPNGAGALYQSLGFELSETNYTKDLLWQQ